MLVFSDFINLISRREIQRRHLFESTRPHRPCVGGERDKIEALFTAFLSLKRAKAEHCSSLLYTGSVFLRALSSLYNLLHHRRKVGGAGKLLSYLLNLIFAVQK